MTYGNYHLTNPFSTTLCVPYYYLYPLYLGLCMFTMIIWDLLHRLLSRIEERLDSNNVSEHIPLLTLTWKTYESEVSLLLGDYMKTHFRDSPLLDLNVSHTITSYLNDELVLNKLNNKLNKNKIKRYIKWWNFQASIPWVLYYFHNISSYILWILGSIIVFMKYGEWRRDGGKNESGWTQYEGKLTL